MGSLSLLKSVTVQWVKVLANQIERELQVGPWTHCAVYEDDLKRFWSVGEEDREAKIAEFAKRYGFRLRFYRKGLCAIFDKWPRSYCDGGRTEEDCNVATAGPVTREEIALYAYYIWEKEGHPERHALEHWLQAELQLRTARV
jgi:hypothetical protein